MHEAADASEQCTVAAWKRHCLYTATAAASAAVTAVRESVSQSAGVDNAQQTRCT